MYKTLAIYGFFAVLIVGHGFCPTMAFSQSAAPPATGATTKKVGAMPPTATEVRRNPLGLYELTSPRLTLTTDIPLDDELKSWPALLEQAITQWQHYFGVDAKHMDGWHVTAMLIGDREHIANLGLLDTLPGFDEGYQFGNNIYLREQPSVYYRRHLFLHEATHWIMWRLYGGAGSPWFMEGMADMHGTHALKDGHLQMNVLPTYRELVPGWGRLRLINETLRRGVAPTLSEILAYGNQREDHEIRYSWSWAACVFFTNHPKYGPVLKELYANNLDYSDSLSRRFRDRLDSDWRKVQVDWNAFVSDLDFGYDLRRSTMVSASNQVAKKLRDDEKVTFHLASDRGWQSTGVLVHDAAQLRIACSGNFKLRDHGTETNTNWIVEPQGVTIEYYRGNALGCVIASLVTRDHIERTGRWAVHRVGRESKLPPLSSGELFLKVNEPSSGLWDNSGTLTVEISSANH